MDVTPLIREGAQIIQAYAGGSFRISGKLYTGAVIVFPDEVIEWKISTPPALADFAILAERKNTLDVVLFGTGKTMQFIAPELRKALKEMGLSPEAMDTGAACRTYNVLMAEGRRVAAAMLPAV
ncbi:MAG: Mth938-like domain-containing protein [Alphaproteobacteria bacterium]